MEKEREIAKLTNVLRRIARAASHAAWTRDPDAARFCVGQYNKLLSRLVEIEPAVTRLFTALPDNASAEVIGIAAHELAAYFEAEAPGTAARVDIVRVYGCGGRRAWAGLVRPRSCV